MRDQKKVGVIISYVNIVLHMCISIFFTPFLIKSLGQSEYGLYRIVQSFIGQLSIMTFGMSAIVTRNIVYYDVKQQKKEKENFLAMAFAISMLLSVVVFIICMVMWFYAPKVFSESLTPDEIVVARRLMFLLTLNIMAVVINDGYAGLVTGHEKFIVANGVKTARLVLRIVTLIVLLKLGFKSTAIVATDLGLSVLIGLFNRLYGRFVLHERAKFYYFDKKMFKTTLLFCAAILLQSIINQVNQNMDSLILGIMTDSKTVAVYSIALLIFTTYNSLTTALASVFTPKATRLIANNVTTESLTGFVTAPGRYQFIVSGMILIGFIFFGKEFLCYWLGEEYIKSYEITLILIIPTTFQLIVSTCNSILDAKLKRMGRSIIMGIMSIINVISSVIMVKCWGYIGAAYGTALSVIVGQIIITNRYYEKVIGFSMITIYKKILYRLLPCMIAVAAIMIPINCVKSDTHVFALFLCKIGFFMTLYCTSIYFFGMNKAEKSVISGLIKKILPTRRQ